MKKVVLLLAVLNISCSWFKYYDRSQECEELLQRSKAQLETAIQLIDSLEARTKELENAQP